MAVDWTNVFSSNVNRIGYDDESQTLLVEWKSGKTSAYEGVPADVADQASRNWSVGRFINDHVKNNYQHKYV
jgi:hypothetical protein